MSNDKYKMFLNFMYNDLDISKNDIREWVKEAVNDVAERMIAKEWDNFDVGKIVDRWITDNRFWGNPNIKNDFMKQLATKLVEKIDINVK